MQYNSRIIYFQDYCQCNQRALKTERDWLTLCEYCNNRMIILFSILVPLHYNFFFLTYTMLNSLELIYFFYINTVNNLFSNRNIFKKIEIKTVKNSYFKYVIYFKIVLFLLYFLSKYMQHTCSMSIRNFFQKHKIIQTPHFWMVVLVYTMAIIWGSFESNVNAIWWSFSTILSKYHGATIWHHHSICYCHSTFFL